MFDIIGLNVATIAVIIILFCTRLNSGAELFVPAQGHTVVDDGVGIPTLFTTASDTIF